MSTYAQWFECGVEGSTTKAQNMLFTKELPPHLYLLDMHIWQVHHLSPRGCGGGRGGVGGRVGRGGGQGV